MGFCCPEDLAGDRGRAAPGELDVPGMGLVGDDADLAVGGCLLEEVSAVSSSWTWVTRSSVARVTREISEVARMAAMKKEAILTPSGRSRMLAIVV
jgi:hypothetical protein